MSTDWGYRCLTHNDASPVEVQGGGARDALREAWRLRDKLAVLVDPDLDMLDVEVRWYGALELGRPVMLGWINEHRRCEVVLLDEYGGEEAIVAGVCLAKLLVGREDAPATWMQCQRGQHTNGRHRWHDHRLTVEWS